MSPPGSGMVNQIDLHTPQHDVAMLQHVGSNSQPQGHGCVLRHGQLVAFVLLIVASCA